MPCGPALVFRVDNLIGLHREEQLTTFTNKCDNCRKDLTRLSGLDSLPPALCLHVLRYGITRGDVNLHSDEIEMRNEFGFWKRAVITNHNDDGTCAVIVTDGTRAGTVKSNVPITELRDMRRCTWLGIP